MQLYEAYAKPFPENEAILHIQFIQQIEDREMAIKIWLIPHAIVIAPLNLLIAS